MYLVLYIYHCGCSTLQLMNFTDYSTAELKYQHFQILGSTSVEAKIIEAIRCFVAVVGAGFCRI